MQEIIHYRITDTTLGPVAMAATDKGICLVEFDCDETTLGARLAAEFPDVAIEPSDSDNSSQIGHWIDALAQHLDHGTDLPDLPVDIRGTDFEVMVWRALRDIPEGQVMGYGKLAEKIGQPRAVRAVASACGRNRIGILIPCHRVLRSSGELGGYRWGLARKKALLEAEKMRVK